MLTLLAATLVLQRDATGPGLDRTEVQGLFAERGYRPVTDLRGRFRAATGEVEVFLSPAPSSKSGRYEGVWLERRWEVSRYVSHRELDAWRILHPGPTNVQTSLAKVVTARVYLDLKPRPNRAALVANVDRFLTACAGLTHDLSRGRRFRSIRVEDRPRPLDPDLKVDGIEAADLWAIVESKGWIPKGPWGGGAPGWVQPFSIHDRTLWASQILDQDSRPVLGFELSALVPHPGSAVEPPANPEWGKVRAWSPDKWIVQRRLAFKEPVRVGDIVAEIETFANRSEGMTNGIREAGER